MRVRLRPSFLLYLLSIALCGSVRACVGAVCALGVHEFAHLAVGWSLGERFSGIEFTPFGGVMTSEGGGSPANGWRGALVAAAGPLGNYGAILLFASPAVRHVMGDGAARQIALSNAVMMGFNLLPALPLDGGRIVFCLGRGALGVSRSIRMLTGLGVAIGMTLAVLSAWTLAGAGVLNLSAAIVGAYLIVCALRSRTAMLAENLCAVVHERCAKATAIRRMRLYDVPPETRIRELVDWMERSEAAGFCVRTADETRYLSEETICLALLRAPETRVQELFGTERQNQGAEKRE